MALEGPLASIDNLVERTRQRLNAHRQTGGTEESFAEALVQEFVTQASMAQPGAGAIHMAVSLFRLVLKEEECWELRDQIAMRDDALNVLFDIRDLP